MIQITVKKDYQKDHEGQEIRVDHLVDAKAAAVQLMDIFMGFGDDSVIIIKKAPGSLDANGSCA